MGKVLVFSIIISIALSIYAGNNIIKQKDGTWEKKYPKWFGKVCVLSFLLTGFLFILVLTDSPSSPKTPKLSNEQELKQLMEKVTTGKPLKKSEQMHLDGLTKQLNGDNN